MADVELQEVFGMPALIQFRDSLARACRGDVREFARLGATGEMQYGFDGKAHRPRGDRAYEPNSETKKDGDEEVAAFSYVVSGMIMPASGGRVLVLYENKHKQPISVLVRPSDIIAVSIAPMDPSDGREPVIQRP